MSVSLPSCVSFVRGLCAAVFVLGAASAQTVIQVPGRPPIDPVPHDQADWSCGDAYYVDAAAGSDLTGSGSLASPWKTVSFAVPQALNLTATGNPITINLRAGSYAAPGESFPIRLPARGIKLQAYEPGATISGQPFQPILQVNRKGRQSGPCGVTPDTVIRGLTLRDGLFGIEIDTSLVGNPASTPDRVRVQRCTIVHNTAQGISIRTNFDRRSQHVIEENEIAFNMNSNGFGKGIGAFHDGPSSCLIRANVIHDNEVGIDVFGTSAAEVRPRIVSNIVHDSEWGISLARCSSYLVNNTQGYGRPFSSGVGVLGVALGLDGDHVVANNIMWNPPSYAVGAAFVVDYDVSGFNGTTVEATNWILQTVGIGNPPQFVAPPLDLHLLPTSPLLDAGTNSFVLPVINLTAGTITARGDVGPDVDGDSRVLDFARDGAADVEIGADERTDGGGASVRLQSPNVDLFGNVITGGFTTTITLNLSTRPNDLCLVYLWQPSDQDPITQNVFQNPFGNWRIATGAPTGMRIGTGAANAAGLFTMNLTLDPAVLGFERQVYVQALTTDAAGALGTISNRLLLEVNQ